MCRSRGNRGEGPAKAGHYLWWPFLCCLIIPAVGVSCARPRSPRPSIDDDAREYVRLAVALGERDPDSIDFYAGPPELVATVRRDPPPLAEIRRRARALEARLNAGPPTPRGQRVAAGLVLIASRVDSLTGTRLLFDAESVLFFGVKARASDAVHMAEVRAKVASMVGGSGSRPLVDRYAAFASRFVVPPERVRDVFDAALDECRRRTVAHVRLPGDESVSVEYVASKPWAAMSRLHDGHRSVIQINTDFSFTVDQLLELACHEGYPGHHVRNLIVTANAAVAPERWVQLTFSPASRMSEVAAMEAADIAFTRDERVAFERDRLFPIAGLAPVVAQGFSPADIARDIDVERLVGELQVIQPDVARRYLDGDLEFERAVTELEAEALVPHAEGLVKYINEYRSYITTYTDGRALVAAGHAPCGEADEQARWRCFVAEMTPRE
jgi:hypothetical protein